MKKNSPLRVLMIAVIAVIIASCKTTVPTTSAGGESDRDGSSFEKAIVAKSIDAEYQWVGEHYPGSRVTGQALVFKEKKPYDVLTVSLAGGGTTKVHFDISSFFGKGF